MQKKKKCNNICTQYILTKNEIGIIECNTRNDLGNKKFAR